MYKFTGEETTTDLFNIFHDEYKERVTPHLTEQFRGLSGLTKEQTDACYWHNAELPNDKDANKRIISFLQQLDEESTSKRYESVEEITAAFIRQGWNNPTFREMTENEDECCSMEAALKAGHKFFRMIETGNVFDEHGNIYYYKS